MDEETRTGPQALVPANDNGDPASPAGRPALTVAAKLDLVVLDIARLIGRQLAREAIEAGQVANDNRPSRQREEGGEPDCKSLGNKREDMPP
ncbi:hypothetical protein EN858_33340 [Mesorhizobium sp. M4B.F.Ca.ET.215.01.1.1]|uniref:hypothetical protein n=1 Tax=unclassified Mesorhizobium TaxID=325217 RepID=UPI000FD4A03E|nr:MULTISPECIES: hypothetical protein [unclassified Mesorhizobium]RUW18081.1 hypothetical protein EOA34_32730 [Mesorhizobium sp. M4B.F.Ca.ET.013.02.1.1]RWF59948.1 MAG: hypothetical protein EOS47_31855 [Mesorhizobium sp.]TGQ03939.1 hypothetical protein EN858_33340 [Mesorhizobium sp. M4B.F.Ca.ET.215.01.1.1]TGQ24042.1 hypothetical protein EN863_063940 [Mesorhizobium sp. M00.F.Ca.ET.220.01.1.1]TGQ27551.1 hypothetical protein EN857_32940 [Mesorhizobium sp. M4B.F.Ca.ET.214.01.1.1]